MKPHGPEEGGDQRQKEGCGRGFHLSYRPDPTIPKKKDFVASAPESLSLGLPHYPLRPGDKCLFERNVLTQLVPQTKPLRREETVDEYRVYFSENTTGTYLITDFMVT